MVSQVSIVACATQAGQLQRRAARRLNSIVTGNFVISQTGWFIGEPLCLLPISRAGRDVGSASKLAAQDGHRPAETVREREQTTVGGHGLPSGKTAIVGVTGAATTFLNLSCGTQTTG